MREKMAVVAPIPSASVSIAVRAKTGDSRICRNAYEISCRRVCISAIYDHFKRQVPRIAKSFANYEEESTEMNGAVQLRTPELKSGQFIALPLSGIVDYLQLTS